MEQNKHIFLVLQSNGLIVIVLFLFTGLPLSRWMNVNERDHTHPPFKAKDL
ncbi:hypothetical protein [Jeotgalibacillus soli]|uniref:Uncharacterized protein n=1 Tax=Jeotgalibacillus soli TaxID=889306 RepID=A0A0C2VN83_9BACL|nr:hypothetical protein [Jeotgalibacillus soli]KIL45463.1 hypothetical protein KP78_30070 [Jeotgalibacillus soli]